MWKWISALVLALVVGFVFGKVTTMHHEKYSPKPPYHNEFSKRYNDRGMGSQWMCGPLNGGPMMGKCPKCQPMDIRMPDPCNNMCGNCGCCNRPRNDDNRCGCRCGPNRECGNKMERKHGNDCDDDNENEDDDEDDD